MSKNEKPYPLTRPFLDTAVGDDGRLMLHVRQATNKGYAVCVSGGGGFDPSYPSSVYRRSRTKDDGNIASAIMANESLCMFIEYTEETT